MAETKEKILQTALYLFALEGYEAVSVSNIADEIDISKGALYKHFKNKRDIFNSIIEQMKELENNRLPKLVYPKKESSETLENFNKKIYLKIKEQTLNFYKFWTEEPFARDFRRMIILEQFRNPEMNDLYQQYLVSGPLKEIETIFITIHKMNPKSMAYKFYSQVHLLISLSDSAECLEDAEELLNEHLEEFGEKYFFIRKDDKIQVEKIEKSDTVKKHRGLLQLAQELNS